MINKFTAVIWEEDPVYRKMFTGILTSWGIKVNSNFNTSEDVLKYISEKQPDIFLLSVNLNEHDRVKYTNSVKKLSAKTMIVQSSYPEYSYVLDSYRRSPVLRKEFCVLRGENVEEKDFSAMSMVEDIISEVDDGRILSILNEFHFPQKSNGVKYITTAVRLMINSRLPPESILITKEIYPEVAKEHSTKSCCVEREIRYYIVSLIEKGKLDGIIPNYAELRKNGNYKLSNSKFLELFVRIVVNKLLEKN